MSVTDRIDLNTMDATYLSYLPLAHSLERNIYNACLGQRAKIGIYQGNILKLKEDLAILKPTVFASVPRLFNKMYTVMKKKLNALTGIKKWLATKATKAKLSNLHKKAQYTHWLYDCLVFNKTKAVLGGRVKMLVTGSAPISQEVIDFLKIAF